MSIPALKSIHDLVGNCFRTGGRSKKGCRWDCSKRRQVLVTPEYMRQGGSKPARVETNAKGCDKQKPDHVECRGLEPIL